MGAALVRGFSIDEARQTEIRRELARRSTG
jgi:hypothetical protein